MRAPIQRSRGFTLIELMIAVTIGLIILASLTSFFVRTSDNRRELERNARQIENGRYAVNALRDDLMLAGFYSDITQPPTTVWNMPDACVTDTATMGFKPDDLNPEMPVPVFVYPNGVGRPTACTPNWVSGTDVIVIRRFNSEPVTVASITGSSAAAYQTYVQVAECKDDDKSTPFLVALGSGASAFKLRQVDCKTVADVRRYREQVYYVRNFSVVAGDGIATLVRVELDGTAAATVSSVVPLVDGIDSLKVDWGIDNDGDGLPDVWSRCDPCTAANWSNVTNREIFILSRNLEPSQGYTDDKAYSMGLSGATSAANDSFKRHVYSAQVAMPNRSGPREPAFKS